jgi:putative hemolysin
MLVKIPPKVTNMHNAVPKLGVNVKSRLVLTQARSPAAVEEVQRLRYRVFAEEIGAIGRDLNGRDQDFFDPYCDHLLVRDTTTNRVVGTYRMLNHASAGASGGFYSEREFDLERLIPIKPHIVETGRDCVDPAYRSGAVIAMLWTGLVRYARNCGGRYLMGCASIPLSQGREQAGTICNHVRYAHPVPPQWRVRPRIAFDYLRTPPTEAPRPPLPSLLKGYLRAGAYVCGEPAWDPDFNTADLLILLPLDRISPRYANHFDP